MRQEVRSWSGRALAAAAVALLAACGGADRPARGVAVGQPLPEYEAATLAGESIELDDLKGRVVVLNVWATWCPPCREEMPGLQRLHEQLGAQGVEVVAVSIDGDQARADIEGFLRQHGITFTILWDPKDRISRLFQLNGIPVTYLIGHDGRLLHQWIGKIDPASPRVLVPLQQALVAAKSKES